MVKFVDFEEAMELERLACRKIIEGDPNKVQRKAQREYDDAPRCPHCGTKAGFAMGTGDCGCETTFEVGM